MLFWDSGCVNCHLVMISKRLVTKPVEAVLLTVIVVVVTTVITQVQVSDVKCSGLTAMLLVHIMLLASHRHRHVQHIFIASLQALLTLGWDLFRYNVRHGCDEQEIRW